MSNPHSGGQQAALQAAAREEMLAHGFEPDFPPAVATQVQALQAAGDATQSAATKAANIRDLRTLPWSSIDNPESRDLDQVEYAEQLPDGSIRLLIGIADVDALVARATPIDDHAAKNTTSLYLGVAIFPMLPEALSTDLTSLVFGEDRLAHVIELKVAADGTVTPVDAYRAVLRNAAKLDYERRPQHTGCRCG
jgi:exoribonuclease-2